MASLDRLLQLRVLRGIEAIVAVGLAVDAGLQDRLEALLADLRAGHERRDLLLLLHLPVDVGLDIRMIDVDDDHLGRAARGAAGLDGAGRAVADLEEAHQARRLAAARQASRSRARSDEKLEPVPEPYLNRRASRTHRSMMPFSLTRSSSTDWMKQACGCGCS